jgi:hypothetical protein
MNPDSFRQNATHAPGRRAGRIWDLLRLATAEPAEQLTLINLEAISREHGGKTALFTTFLDGPLLAAPDSGLELAPENPQEMTALIQKVLAAYQDLTQQGLRATLKPEAFRYHLFDAEEVRVVLQGREVIGQILTHTTAQSDPDQQLQYRRYVQNLTQADVLWVVMPYPGQATQRDQKRFESDLQTHVAFLREALGKRQTERPCAVAVVVNKLDGAFDSEEEARAALTDDRLVEMLGRVVGLIERSRRIGAGAIFPVSAFGFRNAILQASPTAPEPPPLPEPRGSLMVSGEPEYLLKPGATPRPFNLTALVWWSCWAGLLHKQVEVRAGEEPALADIVRRLEADLHAMKAWFVALR